jgi:hypothetical protein
MRLAVFTIPQNWLLKLAACVELQNKPSSLPLGVYNLNKLLRVRLPELLASMRRRFLPAFTAVVSRRWRSQDFAAGTRLHSPPPPQMHPHGTFRMLPGTGHVWSLDRWRGRRQANTTVLCLVRRRRRYDDEL